MYNVLCYKNTGYNPVNIPDSLDFIKNHFTPLTLPAIDIIQNEGLDSVTVRATWAQVQGIDYCVIEPDAESSGVSACYCVGVPSMEASDVCTLPLIYDAVTSSGGPGAITFLDGITERHTTSDDTMFKYASPDPLTTPREPLQLNTGSMRFAYRGGDTDFSGKEGETSDGKGFTAIETSIDLYKLGKEFDDSGKLLNGEGMTFTDGQGNNCTVPLVEGLDTSITNHTNYAIGDGNDSRYTRAPGTNQYDPTFDVIKRGLGALRSLSAESSLISQVRYPADFVSPSIDILDGSYSVLRGKDQTVDITELQLNPYGTIQNNRLLYGDYNKYGLITAAGNKAEFLPEQIMDTTDKSPQVRAIADPRPDGKPYFRYKKYLKNDSFNAFFMSAVSGLPWCNVPLIYNEASGSYLTQQNMQNGAQSAFGNYSTTIQTASVNMDYALANTGLSMAQSATNAVFSAINSNTGGEASQGVLNSVIDMIKEGIGYKQKKDLNALTIQNVTNQYNLSRQRELQNYGVSQYCVVPQIMFPFNSNIIRDFIGNGVVPYRYRYSDNDVKRIDKLLTMYGYVDSVALTPNLFNCRQYFDYVKASNVTVGGSLPIWKKQLIASQLNAGVRVWHVIPSTNYYSGNPVK